MLVGYKNVRHEVLVCPLDWWPDLAWYEMVVATHERWRAIAARLEEKLKGVVSAEHELIAASTSPAV